LSIGAQKVTHVKPACYVVFLLTVTFQNNCAAFVRSFRHQIKVTGMVE